MDFSPETLRARFHELTAASEPDRAERDLLWTELDTIMSGETALTVAEAHAREAEIRARIRELHELLAPIEGERATCARALGGKTGEPVEA